MKRTFADGVTHRTDADLFVDARRALDRQLRVPPEVRVHVDGGIVTLTGSVQWPAERAEAETAVRAVDGVRRIVNEIVVAHAPSATGLPAPEESA
jgi:osmotically-inducible protein OsmY